MVIIKDIHFNTEQTMKNESLRTFAKQYAELARSPAQDEKRRSWKKLNSFKFQKPLIYMRAIPYHEFFDFSVIKSEDPLLRRIETELATSVIYKQRLDDDYIFEPWIKVRAKFTNENNDRWGVPCSLGEKIMAHGAAAFVPQIKKEEDIEKVIPVKYEIDEKATQLRMEKAQEAVGDILDVVCDRQGIYCQTWIRDISTDIAKIRGLEQIMWDMMDRPEWLHRLLSRMRDTILADIDKTEKAGNFRRHNNENQAISYCEELAEPDASTAPRKTSELWTFMASQEYTGIGPDLYDEFLLQFQKPITERFGMASYGCCEDLTLKIPLLKKFKNIRRIAITPCMNVRKSAEQLGKDYIASYRPNPTDMIAHGLDETTVRKIVKRDYEALKENNCAFDITLKDVETIAGKPENMINWVKLIRKIGEEVFGQD